MSARPLDYPLYRVGTPHPSRLIRTTMLKELKKREERTPDFSKLRMMKEIYVFVYSEEKSGGSGNDIFHGARFSGEGMTVDAAFQMKTTEKFHVPIVFDSEKIRLGRVEGELYACSVEHIHLLDVFYSNGVRFKRIVTEIHPTNRSLISNDVLYYKDARPIIRAFMYVAIPEYWENFNLSIKYLVSNHIRGAHYSHYIDKGFDSDDPTDFFSGSPWGRGVHVG